MCRHRQQVQRWGQILRSSQQPQPSEVCAGETQWFPHAEISSFTPPSPAVRSRCRCPLWDVPGQGLLRCRARAPAESLPEKPSAWKRECGAAEMAPVPRVTNIERQKRVEENGPKHSMQSM